jgi:hypothetical protein
MIHLVLALFFLWQLWALLRDGQCKYFYYISPRFHVLFVGNAGEET